MTLQTIGYCIGLTLVMGGVAILLMLIWDAAEAWLEELIKKWRNKK